MIVLFSIFITFIQLSRSIDRVMIFFTRRITGRGGRGRPSVRTTFFNFVYFSMEKEVKPIARQGTEVGEVASGGDFSFFLAFEDEIY